MAFFTSTMASTRKLIFIYDDGGDSHMVVFFNPEERPDSDLNEAAPEEPVRDPNLNLEAPAQEGPVRRNLDLNLPPAAETLLDRNPEPPVQQVPSFWEYLT